jgi:RNA polymerase-associated protein
VSAKRSVMVLYSGAECPYCHRIRMVLAEKGLKAEIVNCELPDLPDELMDFNPYGTVPTLVDRDLKLYESRIIAEYLDERFPHPPLLPVDPVNKASARTYILRVDKDWYSLMETILKAGRDKSAQARKQLQQSLVAADPIFQAKPFFMSDEFGMADCFLAPLIWRLPSLGIELTAKQKGLRSYGERIFARDGFKKSLTDEEIEMRQ